MFDPTDSENDQSQNREARYLEFIELLIDKSIKRLKSESYKPRIQDALRAICLKEKVFKSSEGEKNFWQSIEEMRREKWEEEQPPTDGLESEIKTTILELKDQVENGHLPVKSITDTFNQGRSSESQLTYHRVGHILTDMGFRKVKIHNNTSAILWDDDLLSQKGLCGDEKIENQPPPSPPSPPTPPLPEVSLSPKGSYGGIMLSEAKHLPIDPCPERTCGGVMLSKAKHLVVNPCPEEIRTKGLLPPRVFSWSSS